MKERVIRLFIIWRLWLFIPLLVAIAVLPFRDNSWFTTIWQKTQLYPVVSEELVYPWANFDGAHYLSIASKGYQDEGRFLPFFPMLIRFLATPFSIFYPLGDLKALSFWTAMLVSTASAFLAVVYLAKLLSLTEKRQDVVETVVYLLAFPTAFFFACLYSEGLFLLLSVLSLYFAKKKNWLWSAVCAMLLAVTRLSGILILVPLLYEFFRSAFEQGSQQRVAALVKVVRKELLYFSIVPVLLLAYAYYNQVTWGDPLYFVHAHGALGNSREVAGIVLPHVLLYRYFRIFLTVSPSQYEYWIAVLEFVSALYACFLFVVAWIRKIDITYLLFALVMIVLPIFSGTLSGFPRYILPVFPLFLVQAQVLRKHPKIRTVVLVIFVALQAALFALFSRGYYVA